MPTTVPDIYTDAVQKLEPAERLRLAALLLADLKDVEFAVMQSRDYWDDEDLRDLTAYSLANAAALYPEEESLV